MGMGMLFVAAVVAAALSWVVLARRGNARPAKTAALMLTGLGVGFFLLFAVAELAGGDVAGVQHLLPAAVLGALLWLGWKRPRTAGIVLLALAVPLGVAFVVGVAVEGVRPGELWVAVLIPLVPALTALLFLRAGRGER